MATGSEMPVSRHGDALFAALRAAVVGVYGERLEALAVFGSWARGTATPESDRDRLLGEYLAGLRARMEALGSTRKTFKGGVFWDYKPDFRPGEVVEL